MARGEATPFVVAIPPLAALTAVGLVIRNLCRIRRDRLRKHSDSHVAPRQEAVMKLSGQISIELTVDDFVAAADHQRRLEGLLSLIRDSYPDATLAMRERRERKALALPRVAPRAAGTVTRYGEG
jgi:hypothetical protein